jgi:methylenetetrahydrofolate reductase (NADPH)
VPPSVASRLDRFADDPRAFRAAGIDVVTELSQRLIDEGVPGVHFYTFNMSKATTEVVARLGLLPART